MDLSIIIVNYKSPKMVIDCLRSIFSFTKKTDLEILIVDNNSDDQSQELISFSFPNIQWIQMGYNAGYARANNEGIRQAKEGIILLLNPDVLFEDDSLQKCYQSFSHSAYDGCGVQLLNPDKSLQVSGGYFIRGGLNNLLLLPVIGKIFKWLGNLLQVKKTSLKNANAVHEVDWVNGAFIMIKKDVIIKAGPLDEDFFLYAEEIEWCSRIRKSGKMCIYGDLHAIHLQGETTNQAFDSSGKGYYNLYDKKGRQILVSNFLRIRKQFGVGWFMFHLGCYFIEIPFFFLFVLIRTILFFRNEDSFSKFGGYVSNLFYLLGVTGKIIHNKPYFYKTFD